MLVGGSIYVGNNSGAAMGNRQGQRTDLGKHLPKLDNEPKGNSRDLVYVAFRVRDGVGTRNVQPFAAQWLACMPPVNASRTASRLPAHDLEPMWFATPSS